MVAFCREALRLFAIMSVACHTVRSLPRAFSVLQLICNEYTGFRLIEQSVDIGFDIAAEYEKAVRQAGW